LLGGILAGIFTPTEAAAVAAFYALVVTLFLTRTLRIKELPSIFIESAVQSGVILFLVGASVVFAWIITVSGLAGLVASGMMQTSDNVYILLFLANLFLFIVGMFLDAGPAVLILGPILGPLFVAMGVDPIHFAVVMCVNVTVGLATPPMGLVLFVAASVSKERVETIARQMLPFLAVEISVIFLITYFPALSMTLPRLLGFA
jgi:tripartite ATP-independent transporter DctM subunit